jgi:type 1 glutamine amidotransferase
MKQLKVTTFLILLTSIVLLSFYQPSKQPKVLVFCKTAGYHHASIPIGIAAIQKMGKENGFIVDTTTDAARFNDKQLSGYAAVIFLSTTGNVLDSIQEASFQRYIEGGGGFVGIHAASDTEYDWSWYGQLVGGYFDSHPEIQQATLTITDPNQLSTKKLPNQWTRTDEWYNFKNLSPQINVLLTIDEASYKGGKNGAFHPVAWQHRVLKGKAFYTALGHTEASYQEPLFLKHLKGGILYVLGKK